MCEHQKIFMMILKSKIFQDKKKNMYGKPFIKIIGILLLIFRCISLDQTDYYSDHRKNKSLLMFLN